MNSIGPINRSGFRSGIRLLAGGAIVALTLYAIAAAPGFLSDRASTTSPHSPREVRR